MDTVLQVNEGSIIFFMDVVRFCKKKKKTQSTRKTGMKKKDYKSLIMCCIRYNNLSKISCFF